MDQTNINQQSFEYNPESTVNYNPGIRPVSNVATQNGIQISLGSELLGSHKTKNNQFLKKGGVDLGRVLGVLLGLLMIGFVIIHLEGDSADPFENVINFWNQFFPEEVSYTEGGSLEKAESDSENINQEEVLEGDNSSFFESVVERPEFSPSMIHNPYEILPNTLYKDKRTMSGYWNVDMEESWTNGLAHEYIYQRYKTVKNIRKSRKMGSSFLLYEALRQRKFWIRMEAILALAEFGESVTVSDVKKAIGKARSSLIKNYFKRLANKPTNGELFVLKHSIKITPPKARWMALKILARKRGAENNLYLVAATFDRDLKIRRWAKEELLVSPVNVNVSRRFKALVVDGFMKKQVASDQTQAPRPMEPEGGIERLQEVETGIESVEIFDIDSQEKEVELDLSDDIDDSASVEEEKTSDGFDEIGGRESDEGAQYEDVDVEVEEGGVVDEYDDVKVEEHGQ